jgi:hypothetical protein
MARASDLVETGDCGEIRIGGRLVVTIDAGEHSAACAATAGDLIEECLAREIDAATARERERCAGILLERAKARGDIANRIAATTRDPSKWRDYEIRQDECSCAVDAIRALLNPLSYDLGRERCCVTSEEHRFGPGVAGDPHSPHTDCAAPCRFCGVRVGGGEMCHECMAKSRNSVVKGFWTNAATMWVCACPFQHGDRHGPGVERCASCDVVRPATPSASGVDEIARRMRIMAEHPSGSAVILDKADVLAILDALARSGP